MPSPFFSRFYKCDLQMQTPLAPQWREAATKLRSGDTDERKRHVARLYLQRCHEVGLEVIGITDHNFATDAADSFVNQLREENESVARGLNRSPLTIFPGFEVEVNVGRGCHVLCLFPHDVSLSHVHDKLTALGLPGGSRFASGGQPRALSVTLSQLLEIVQDGTAASGVVIAAHPLENSGLFDSDRISEWLQQDEFRNGDLLCLEVPCPVTDMSTGWQRLLGNGDDCQPDWRRKRPVALVMSSDCYRLVADGTDPGNHIGYRHTWIRMTSPCIESLRQAFLDHSSRIRLQVNSPEEEYVHPRILSVHVKDALFLRRLEEAKWSPNLHCLIGSRGTGKSSLVDYMRLALGRMADLPAALAEEVKDRIKDTLPDGATVEVRVQTLGGRYRVVFRQVGEGEREIYREGSTDPDPNLDIRALFPCRFLSQREIDHTVGKRDRDGMRRFLDDFVRHDIEAKSREEEQIKGEIRQVQARIESKRSNLQRRRQVATERADLASRLEHGAQIQAALAPFQAAQAEDAYASSLIDEARHIEGHLENLMSSIEDRHSVIQEPDGPNAPLLRRAKEIVDSAVSRLQEDLVQAMDRFRAVAVNEGSALDLLIQNEWAQIFAQATDTFRAAAPDGVGIGYEHITRLTERLARYDEDLLALESDGEEVTRLEESRLVLLRSLRDVWVSMTQIRRGKAEELMNRLRPPGTDQRPLVGLDIRHQGDNRSLLDILDKIITDRRRLTRDDLQSLLQAISQGADDDQPLMERFVALVRERSTRISDVMTGRRAEALYEIFNEETLRKLELTRVPDAVTYLVYRHDGTLAGPIERVSAGQQGTAILNLLLADGDEPLIIDTPEEGLDSEGAYTDLVPLFRREKERRQIIVVTHNANIPVCGDAEGILGLEAVGYVSPSEIDEALQSVGLTPDEATREVIENKLRWKSWEEAIGRYAQASLGLDDGQRAQLVSTLGQQRKAEARLKRVTVEGNRAPIARGALDVEVVRRTVQDVMEGSREAFERRREKYGF